MLYRHEKTGAILEAKSEMGGCWIPVQGTGRPPGIAPEKAKKPKSGKK